ncbi:hypothetical protein B296_00040004 [Ensete ventricosum]|uniref:Uncharacterized protein n=1 Tax=Ensete ventricosum TaxID=4639 RepID=A0A426ZS31_ENSVE|nr:hypothetical protein B296_00040004 [Ensete ventricosum]
MSITIDFDRYRVCSSYRPVQGGPRTDKPSDRYIPPVPGGTGWPQPGLGVWSHLGMLEGDCREVGSQYMVDTNYR